MKKLWLIITILAIVSCKNEPQIDYAIISGDITNANSEIFSLYNKVDMSVKKKLSLENDGKFIDTIKLDGSSLFAMRQNRNMNNLYLSKGDNVVINYDAKDYENTLTITGKGSNVCNYLIQKEKDTKALLGNGTEIYTKEEAAYKTAFLDVKKAQEDLLYNYDGLPEEFKKEESKNINYTFLANLNKYKNYHSYYAKKPNFEPSGGFLEELNGLDYSNEEDYKFSTSYTNLVSSKYRDDASKLAKKDSIETDIAILKIANGITNKTIKNSLLYNNARFSITYTKDLEGFYAEYIKGSTDEKNNKEITESYHALKKLVKGNVSPKFTDYENNAGGTTSLDDLKGKYVYIDVWATWCGPCIREIPSLKKVEKQFHNKNIEFVSISIDVKKDHEKWKKMIVDKELGGLQLFADSDWKSKFVEDYMIKGIPRFIIVDPKGNIISANAPRPSDKKLVEFFEELNI